MQCLSRNDAFPRKTLWLVNTVIFHLKSSLSHESVYAVVMSRRTECRGKRRRHRSPKWKTVSKQARQTCGRRTEDERRDGDRPKNAIVGQHFNGKLEWHCEEDRGRERERERDCLSDSRPPLISLIWRASQHRSNVCKLFVGPSIPSTPCHMLRRRRRGRREGLSNCQHGDRLGQLRRSCYCRRPLIRHAARRGLRLSPLILNPRPTRATAATKMTDRLGKEEGKGRAAAASVETTRVFRVKRRPTRFGNGMTGWDNGMRQSTATDEEGEGRGGDALH